MTPLEQLAAISVRVHELVGKLYDTLNGTLLPMLLQEGIRFLKPEELSEEQHAFVKDYFAENIFPVLTPMAVDASHPFPMLFRRCSKRLVPV